MATTELAIIRPENIQEIVQGAPGAYNANSTSLQRCTDYGQDLLNRIRQKGMTDELDAEAAEFIERARKTLKKMNERRSGVTRLFDSIKTEFTTMENAVDPSKKGTPAWEVQQERNAYAAKKREEEQRRQREEAERRRREQEEAEFRSKVERIIRRQMSAYTKKQIDSLQSAFNYATLDNYEATVKAIREFAVTVPQEFAETTLGEVRSAGFGLPEETVNTITADVLGKLKPQFDSYYAQQVEAVKTELLDKFPSKRAQLEKAAAASAEEAARIKAQMEAADRAAAERRAAEQAAREEEERRRQKAERQQQQMASLFNQTAAETPGYQAKIKVTKKIEILNPEGILPVLSTWFSREGYKMSVDDLCKMFKKQITYCEKIANAADPVFIRDESVDYVDDVKAK